MSKEHSTLTQRRLKSILVYDVDTGIFTRRVRTSQNNRAGDIAGSIHRTKNSSYCRIAISVDGKQYKAHHLAWLYVHGVWPIQEIDHKDGNACNNKIDNLREVTHAVNCQNMRKVPSHNTSGYVGVFYEKRQRKFIAKINVSDKQVHLGTYTNPEEAHAAYVKAKRALHEGCTI